MKKKTGLCIAIVLALYMLLLALLTATESACASSSIRSFGDALWYSLVTITTVGYGDLYPVSPIGRVIGIFFLLLSMGFLAFLASAVYSLLSGRLWPAMLLRIKRQRHWFLFSERNAASEALARDLDERYPGSLIIFCGVSGDDRLQGHRNWLYLSKGIEKALHPFKPVPGKRTAFLISENELQNRDDAYALRDSEIELYCCSEEIDESKRISCFDPYECCARQYWKTHPLRRDERMVMLVGDGRYAQTLLSSAIIANCMAPMFTTQYHMFGSWQPYRREHYCLGQVLAIDCESDEKDSLFFHESAWNADPQLIAQADRIIFCFDDEDENARCAQRLEQLFSHRASVYARTSHRLTTGMGFGDAAEIYTAELVMKRRLDRMAEQIHAAYRRMAGGPTPDWRELNAFSKGANRAAADHIPTKIRLLTGSDALDAGSLLQAVEAYKNADAQLISLCRQNEHERWMRFQSLNNWQYAPVRDNNARRHPCMIPYEQLSGEEKAKDDLAWQQLEQLNEAPEIRE